MRGGNPHQADHGGPGGALADTAGISPGRTGLIVRLRRSQAVKRKRPAKALAVRVGMFYGPSFVHLRSGSLKASRGDMVGLHRYARQPAFSWAWE